MGLFNRTKDETVTETPSVAVENISGDYTLDPSHTRIGFSARHAMVTKVRGHFDEFEGSAHVDTVTPANSRDTSKNQRGSGVVNSTRMEPISRSYTMDSEVCMPLNSWIIATRPGVM